MDNDVQFQSVADVDSFAESTNSSLNYLILEASGWSHVTFHNRLHIITLAIDLFVLPTPTVWWCRRSGCQLLPTELSRNENAVLNMVH